MIDKVRFNCTFYFCCILSVFGPLSIVFSGHYVYTDIVQLLYGHGLHYTSWFDTHLYTADTCIVTQPWVQSTVKMSTDQILLNRTGCVPACDCGVSLELKNKLRSLNILADSCHGHELHCPPSNHAICIPKSAGRKRWRKRSKRGGKNKQIRTLINSNRKCNNNLNTLNGARVNIVNHRTQTLVRIPFYTDQAPVSHLNNPILPTFYMTNAQSIGNKFEEAEIIFGQNEIDIGVITETWFSNKMPENQLDIPNYILFSKCRSGKRGGGVGIYVKDDISASIIDDLVVPAELECIWVKVRPKRLPRSITAIAICAVYITTNSPNQNLLEDHLLESVDSLRSKYPGIGVLILGDFNRMDMHALLRGNDLYQIIEFNTRANAKLDLMLTNSTLRDFYADPRALSPIGLSDHVSVLWKPKSERVAAMNNLKTKITRPLNVSGIQSFGSWIQRQNWHEVLENGDTQGKANAFYSILDLGVSTCFPEKKRKIHNKDKPWITQKIKHLVLKRQKAFELGKVMEWRKLRNQVKREVEKAKITYHANRIRDLQKTDPRKWHQQIKKVTNSSTCELRLDVPGIDDGDDKGIANAINSMFANVSAHVPPLDTSQLPAYQPAQEPPPSLYPWEVYTELQNVNPNKAGGPDGIPSKLIKEFAYEFSVPFADIINCSLREGIVPTQWKKAIVVPIPKQNPPRLDKLRPISLTSIFAKIAEGFVASWVLDDIGEAIDRRQFGNIPGVSTSHYVTSLLHFLHLGAEKSHNVGTVVLTDFSKAFDLVNHTVLINKMLEMGVRRNIVPWICDFLRNRQQCVRYNSTLSEFVFLSGSVPQGTKIGPIGFQVVINDAAIDANSECWKYVDDMTLAENRNISERGCLQNDLDVFYEWSQQNGQKLNPSKCHAMEVCFSRAAPVHSNLMIGTSRLLYVDKAKVLGLWLQSNLKWEAQVEDIVKKANRRLFMLRSLKRFGFDHDELVTVYRSYVRPVIEYGDVVWHSGLTSKQINDLEKIQKRACRTIQGREYSSYSEALSSCDLMTLEDRRIDHCLKFAKGLADNDRTKHLLPPTRIESHGRNLRNSNKISQIPTKTKRFQQSPIPYFVKLLNTS